MNGILSKLKKNINKFLKSDAPLESKVFKVILFVGFAITAVSSITTFFQGMGKAAVLYTVLCAVLFLVIIVINYFFKFEKASRIMLCYVINFGVIPLTFFTCGGIDSGMPLYMVAGLFIIIPLLLGVSRVVCFVLSMLMDVACILVSYNYMDGAEPWIDTDVDILADLPLKGRIIDMISSLILVGLFIGCAVFLMLKAYNKERIKREELLYKLDMLSKKDELTGLYNRRLMYDRYEDMKLFRESTFAVVMIDIDYFKRLNDTYGHLFGDRVLKVIGEALIDECDEDSDEMAVRYGGEEFALFIRCDDVNDAYNRVENIRKLVENLKWENYPDITVTISGGIVLATEYKNISEMLEDADTRLYEAKQGGRNRIVKG